MKERRRGRKPERIPLSIRYEDSSDGVQSEPTGRGLGQARQPGGQIDGLFVRRLALAHTGTVGGVGRARVVVVDRLLVRGAGGHDVRVDQSDHLVTQTGVREGGQAEAGLLLHPGLETEILLLRAAPDVHDDWLGWRLRLTTGDFHLLGWSDWLDFVGIEIGSVGQSVEHGGSAVCKQPFSLSELLVTDRTDGTVVRVSAFVTDFVTSLAAEDIGRRKSDSTMLT